MPDRDNWTAAMVLRWVLTRDKGAVLPMSATYGLVGVFEDGTVSRLAPEDMDAVTLAYCTDPNLPAGEERAVTAVARSERVIAVKDAIYQALRRGTLEACARRNGTGDVEKIASNQWLSLKFQSWNGHDLAVPIDIEADVLDLPRTFENYVGGRVPANIVPTVWPDPLFIEDQVMQLWPSCKSAQMEAAIEVPTRSGDGLALSEPPEGRGRLSDRERRIYEEARRLRPDFDERWGRISEVARLIAKGPPEMKFETARRILTRVLKKVRE
jgi:hypothetical protein